MLLFFTLSFGFYIILGWSSSSLSPATLSLEFSCAAFAAMSILLELSRRYQPDSSGFLARQLMQLERPNRRVRAIFMLLLLVTPVIAGNFDLF